MVGSLVLNRRKNYSIFGGGNKSQSDYFNPIPNNGRDSSPPCPQRPETFCGIPIQTPDSSRWADHIHSRILWKYPFLIEMFYWAVNYLFYSVTKAMSQWLLPAQIEVVQVAQQHGEDILWFEHESFFSWMFPIQESAYQRFFLDHAPAMMTFFNRIYSLVHIPGTVL
jgi:hypothetical protein